MQFVDTLEGPIVNLSEVITFHRVYMKNAQGKHRLEHYRLHTRDGNTYTALTESFYPEFMMGDVIPAGPNDYAMQVYRISGWESDTRPSEYAFNRLKIVGWRVDGRIAAPILPSGNEFGVAAGDIYVETPDGKYDSLWGDIYDSLEDLKAAHTPKAPVKTDA